MFYIDNDSEKINNESLFSGSIEADYLTATNAVHIMAKLIPELSLSKYLLHHIMLSV